MQRCEICGNTNKASYYKDSNLLLCRNHKIEYRKYGRIRERNVRSKNIINLYQSYGEIILEDKNQNEIGRCKFSIRHYDKVKDIKWHLYGGYVCGYYNQKNIIFHRFITNANKSVYVDHINHNTLDNMDENLRFCKNHQNCANSLKRKSNNSGVIGVHFYENKNKWVAYITYQSKRIYLGMFINYNDAIIARLKAEHLYFKEFAPQRHLFEEYNIN